MRSLLGEPTDVYICGVARMSSLFTLLSLSDVFKKAFSRAEIAFLSFLCLIVVSCNH